MADNTTPEQIAAQIAASNQFGPNRNFWPVSRDFTGWQGVAPVAPSGDGTGAAFWGSSKTPRTTPLANKPVLNNPPKS